MALRAARSSPLPGLLGARSPRPPGLAGLCRLRSHVRGRRRESRACSTTRCRGSGRSGSRSPAGSRRPARRAGTRRTSGSTPICRSRPRPRLGRSRLGRDRTRLRRCCSTATSRPGDPACSRSAPEKLGLAAPRSARLRVRRRATSSSTRDRPRARRVLRAARRRVPSHPGGRRATPIADASSTSRSASRRSTTRSTCARWWGDGARHRPAAWSRASTRERAPRPRELRCTRTGIPRRPSGSTEHVHYGVGINVWSFVHAGLDHSP